jgi:hypothetical protein
MRRALIIAVGITAFIAGAPAAVLACTCMGGLPPCQQLWLRAEEHPSVVFEATVASIDRETRLFSEGRQAAIHVVRLRDRRDWLGTGANVVITSADGAGCGASFEVGRRYIIQARTNDQGELSTSLCALTRPLDRAADLVAYLETLSRPPAGGSVFGTVQLDSRPFSSAGAGPETRSPIPGVRILLSGPVNRSLMTDAAGAFRFDGLPVGEYTVATEYPEHPEMTPQVMTIRQPYRIPNLYACAEVPVTYRVNGIIAGSILDRLGRPVTNAIVDLRLEQPLEVDRPYYQITVTDGLGRFEFNRLPPGRYVAGISLQGGPSRHQPYAMASAAIEIDAGELRTLPPVVTERLETVRVHGVVRDPGGRAVPDVSVVAHPQTELNQYSVAGSAATDQDGRFSVDLLRGVRYTFRTLERGRRVATSKPVVAGDQAVVIVVPHPR